jgi:AmmeMemoRadiSam system protein A
MKKIELSNRQKKDLLRFARMTIEQMLTGKVMPGVPPLSEGIFSEKYGIFVCLKYKGNLRGCIGLSGEIKPLRDAVKEMAVEAAFHDPRFPPLAKNELKDVNLEISILYPMEAVKDIKEIIPGKHGLVMERGYQKGLLLPQVAIEHKWDRDEFLNQTCRKAGMENFCWENDAKIYKFEAVVFNEKQLGL